MSDTSPVLGLPYIQPSQAQKHVTHNEALRVLDAVVQLSVLARDVSLPPAGAVEGDRYLVASSGHGAWAGRGDAIAVFDGVTWTYLTPKAGWQAYVIADAGIVVFDGLSWQKPDLGMVSSLGVNTSADTINRLAVSSEAVLLNHAGRGHQLKVNKAARADTSSLLFQTGFSGRAEIGLAGDDHLAVKVSADGANWNDALRIDAETGSVSMGKQPFFVAKGNGDWATIATANTDLVFPEVLAQRGGVYDSATGIFTAPTGGLYCFLINAVLGDSTDGRVSFSLNGATGTARMQSLSGNMPLSFTVVMPLDTADRVTCRTGDINQDLTYLQSHSTFSGWKVF